VAEPTPARGSDAPAPEAARKSRQRWVWIAVAVGLPAGILFALWAGRLLG
jgi:hypothetical protein